MNKTADKLQKYAMKLVGQDNTIWSKTTRSAYFNFNGTTVRVSDHLPTAGSINSNGVSLSIIITSNPDQYILQQHSTGRLTVVNYERAKEIMRSVSVVCDVFRYPNTPFRVEKEIVDGITPSTSVLGEPLESFTTGQQKYLKTMVQSARSKRMSAMSQTRKKERQEEHLKTPSK